VLGDGQHDDLRPGVQLAHGGARLEPGLGHAEVEQHDVGSPAPGQLDGLAPVAREPHDLDPLVRPQQRSGALAHEAVVVGDQHADRHGAVSIPRGGRGA
jgi:hypothetical protein